MQTSGATGFSADVAVVGAGPAGMMAAIVAAEAGTLATGQARRRVVVLEPAIVFRA